MMGLARRAEAALIEAGFSPAALSVTVPEPGRVQVAGAVATESTMLKAKAVLKGVKGVESIDTQFAVPRDYGAPDYY